MSAVIHNRWIHLLQNINEFEKNWAQIVVEHQIARELQVLLAWAKISILLVGEETVTYLNHQEDVFSEG